MITDKYIRKSTNMFQVLNKNNPWYLGIGSKHYYFCVCGELAILSEYDQRAYQRYVCKKCANSDFIDAIKFEHSHIKHYKKIEWCVAYNYIKQDQWVLKAYLDIPVYDVMLKKIHPKRINLATVTLYTNGKYTYEKLTQWVLNKVVLSPNGGTKSFYKEIADGLEVALCTYVLYTSKQGKTTLSWIDTHMLEKLSTPRKISFLRFFLKYNHLKEVDFFYWKNFDKLVEESILYPTVEGMLQYIRNGREEKSLRKVQFTTYQEAMNKYGYYVPMFDMAYFRLIKDRNHLLQIINISTRDKSIFFENISWKEHWVFGQFLLEHYSEKHISLLLLSLSHTKSTTKSMVRDCIINLISIIQVHGSNNFAYKKFRKVGVNFLAIYGELASIGHLQEQLIEAGNKTFLYNHKATCSQGKYDSFVYKLPVKVTLMLEWGYWLSNCLNSYVSEVKEERALIYGLFKENHLIYVIRIVNNTLEEAKGKHNTEVKPKDLAEIQHWFTTVYQTKYMTIKGELMSDKPI